MKIFYYFFAFILFLVQTSFSYAQLSNTVVKAKIQMEEIEGNIKITGTAENLSEIIQSLTYKLSVIKQHSNNQSTNAQEGLFTLAPGEIKNLSTTQINTSKEDEIIVLLLFYDENKQLIGKDRVVLGNEKKKRKI
jgi:hypothetical protein